MQQIRIFLTDITFTTQMIIFARRVTSEIIIYEKIVSLHSVDR